MIKAKDYIKIATDYAKDVTSGGQIAGREIPQSSWEAVKKRGKS